LGSVYRINSAEKGNPKLGQKFSGYCMTGDTKTPKSYHSAMVLAAMERALIGIRSEEYWARIILTKLMLR